jgi:alpha-N-acetylglucosaminidase
MVRLTVLYALHRLACFPVRLFVSASYWNSSTISALLAGASKDELVLLDLFSEAIPAWNVTEEYFNHRWTWNLLHNFGQSSGMYGSLGHYASEPLRALALAPDTLVGVGLTMEGMNQNEAVRI